MALHQFLIPAGISAAGSIVNYFVARKNQSPPFRGSAYANYLQRIGREGRISPTARRNIIGEVSSRAGNVAQDVRTRLKGYLQSRGFGGSIAGAKLLATPGLRRQEQLGRTAQYITTRNELSKVGAQGEYARQAYRSELRRAAEKRGHASTSLIA